MEGLFPRRTDFLGWGMRPDHSQYSPCLWCLLEWSCRNLEARRALNIYTVQTFTPGPGNWWPPQKRPQRKQIIYNSRNRHYKAHDISLNFFSEMPNQLSVSLKMAVIFPFPVDMPLSYYSCLSKKPRETLNTIEPRLQGLDIP